MLGEERIKKKKKPFYLLAVPEFSFFWNSLASTVSITCLICRVNVKKKRQTAAKNLARCQFVPLA